MTTTNTPVPPTYLELDDINLGDPEFWMRPDVDGALALLRRDRPICWHEHPEAGRGFWSVVRYHDVDQVSRRSNDFRNREGNRLYHDPEEGLVRPASDSMSELDAPEHMRNRRIISKAFTPRALARLDPAIRTIVARIIDNLRGRDTVDFVAHVSSVLPVEMICDLLAVPQADRPHIYDLTGAAMGDQDPEVGGTPEDGTRATRELKAYGEALAEERRRSPGEDIFSQTCVAEVEGERLSLAELGTFFSLLVVAGNETTATGINQGMLALCQFPDQRRRLLDDIGGLERSLVEEILRWGTPTKHVRRVAAHDTVLNGIMIRGGDKVVNWFISANRDEAVFEDPYSFDVTRAPNPQVSFGTGGPHFCLGANLARREIGILFSELLSAFPEMELAEEPRRLRSTLFNGIKEMKVVLHD